MAIGIYFSPTTMTAQRYDECIKRLVKAGANHPKGRSYHASFGAPDKIMVFDVWDSMDSFNKFGQTLMPILSDLGVEAGQPDVMPIHNVIVPPTAKSKAAKAAPKAKAKAKSSKPKKASRKRGRK